MRLVPSSQRYVGFDISCTPLFRLVAGLCNSLPLLDICLFKLLPTHMFWSTVPFLVVCTVGGIQLAAADVLLRLTQAARTPAVYGRCTRANDIVLFLLNFS